LDLLELIKADHDKVRALFKQVESLSVEATTSRRDLFDQIDDALSLHEKIEETVLYPQLEQRSQKGDQRDEVLALLKEQTEASGLIKELEGIEPTSAEFATKLKALIAAAGAHADEEEQKMFPMAKTLFKPDELRTMGEQYVAMKDKAGGPVPQEARR